MTSHPRVAITRKKNDNNAGKDVSKKEKKSSHIVNENVNLGIHHGDKNR